MEVVSPEFCSQVDDLGRNLYEGLHIENANESGGDGVNVRGCERCDPISHRKCLSKSATFPGPGKTSSSTAFSGKDDDQEPEIALRQNFSEESVQPTCSHAVSLPTPLKLVSAMKGSRERQGIIPMKLNVKWAPDVYDPIPTTVSHTVKGKQKKHHKNNDNYKKKNGKKGQKGKGSSSSGGGGRRKHRKTGGNSDKCYESLGFVKSFNVLDNFDVGNADSCCGTSFLKESASQMHYAVAEAL